MKVACFDASERSLDVVWSRRYHVLPLPCHPHHRPLWGTQLPPQVRNQDRCPPSSHSPPALTLVAPQTNLCSKYMGMQIEGLCTLFQHSKLRVKYFTLQIF